MKSKTSFFNKTIFFKTIRRFWLLPAAYMFWYTWAMPVTLFFAFNTKYGIGWTDRIMSMKEGLLSGYLIVSLAYSVVAGILTAQCAFVYLKRHAAVSFFHSLPVDRKQLYFTNLLSGFAMIAVPIVLTSLISLLVCACMGANVISEMAVWLLASLIMAAFFYMFAVICIMFSGQNWFAVIVYLIFMVYVIGVIALSAFLVSMINIGCNINFKLPEGALGIISPVSFFGVGFFKVSKNDIVSGIGSVLSSMSLELIEGTIFIVLFVILAYYLYKFRRSEAAGDTVAFGFAKPIFRWGFAFSFSLLLTVIMIVTISPSFASAKIVMTVFMIIFGMLGFILAQMLLKKSAHVFKLSKPAGFNFKHELVCCGAVMLIAGIVISLVAMKVNKYVPKTENIRGITLNTSYGYRNTLCYDRDVISEVVSIHNDIVDELDEIAKIENGRSIFNLYDGEDYSYFDIAYTMGDGSVIKRNYMIPGNTKAYRHIDDMYNDRNLAIGLKFGDVDTSKIGAAYFVDDTEEEAVACYYNDATALYEAMIADLNDGNIAASDLYYDEYMYAVYKKIDGYYDEDGQYVEIENGFKNEIPFEMMGFDLGSQEFRYVLAFSPVNTDRIFYCVVLNEKCSHILDTMKKSRWFL
ncbi:MAG: hypothetical protein K6G45_10095 [Lachnospiraceae bacterium]|nr:hypothetical protein [Lachnospiraceae bacterium]